MDRVEAQLLENPHGAPAARRRYTLGLARGEAEVRAAQRLRWDVFAGELGACLPARESGVDRDIFDAFCEHLVVREEASGATVGTYRILPPHAARRVGCYYADAEFDLTRLQLIRPQLVEIGRACIHPEHRNGAVIALLWSGIARYMLAGGHRYLAGCASMGVGDGGHSAAAVFARLRARHLAPLEYQVFPRNRLPLDRLDPGRPAEVPPLIRGYLRAGAWVCSEPALDPEFNTADFFLLLPMARLGPRHARHFLGREPALG